MASTTLSSKKNVYVAFDIEKVGRRLNRKDPLFAIGIVVASAEDNKILKTYRCILNLKKPSDVSWEEYWKLNDWEMRCWLTCWIKLENVLDALQSKFAMVETENELANEFNRVLTEIEDEYFIMAFVFDTVTFDSVHLSSLLMEYDHLPINYRRDGSYLCAFEVDSIKTGICQSMKWEYYDQFEKYVLSHYLPDIGDIKHDHDPANDAATIMADFLGCLNYMRHDNKHLAKRKIPEGDIDNYLKYHQTYVDDKLSESNAIESLTNDL